MPEGREGESWRGLVVGRTVNWFAMRGTLMDDGYIFIPANLASANDQVSA